MRYFIICLFFSFFIFLPLKGEASVVINEVAWAGTLNSASDEWIELYNSGEATINLSGWRLLALDGSPDIYLSGSIAAGGFFLLERTDDSTVENISADLIYSGSLANSGEDLELIDNGGIVVDSLNCGDEWLAGDSVGRLGMQRLSGEWQASCDSGGTPASVNEVCLTDESKSEEDDSSQEEVNEEEIDNTEKEVEQAEEVNNSFIENSNNQEVKKKAIMLPQIIFSELLPNPEGVDSDEWIELYNLGPRRVDLSGWVLSDGESEYILPNRTYLRAREYLLLPRSKTNLALNNSADELSLMDGEDLIASVAFQNAKVEESLIFDIEKQEYLWSMKKTPGKENIWEIPNREPIVDFYAPQVKTGEYFVIDASDTVDPDGDSLEFLWNFAGETFRGMLFSHVMYKPGKYAIKLEVRDGLHSVNLTKTLRVVGEEIIQTSLKPQVLKVEISKVDLGVDTESSQKKKLLITKKDIVKTPAKIFNLTAVDNQQSGNYTVEGVVSSLPGSLASQYFYLDNGELAYQIYNYKKDFPKLKLGDKLEVWGEESIVNDGIRVKTKGVGAIKVISKDNQLDSIDIESTELDDVLLGQLVSFVGAVVKKNGLSIYCDDGAGELLVYLKKGSGIKSSVFNVGDKVRITGIFSKIKSGYRILPRDIDDLEFLNSDNLGEVLGEYSSSSTWKLAKREKHLSQQYILLGGVTLMIVMVIVVLLKIK